MNESEHREWIACALERYERPLIHYAWRLTGDAETARDVVQDTFLRLCKAQRREVEDHLAQWLYTVCRNRALDLLEKASRRQTHSGNGTEIPAPSHDENHSLLSTAVNRLPEREQEIVRLKFEHGLTYREIAAILGISAGTVASDMGRAFERLRRALPDRADIALQDE